VLAVGIGRNEAGAATMIVPGDVPDAVRVIVYGVAPRGRVEKLVTKR
jgi:hypothetical protein